MILGIDEAGRGPLIGPMVIAGVMIEDKLQSVFKDQGVKDSKLVTPRKRKILFEYIKKNSKYKIIIIPAKEIDEVLKPSNPLNLNWLEAVKSVEIIDALKPKKVILDCPSPKCSTYTAYVLERVKNKNLEVISEHKADLNHPVVAAASILAKETRELEVEKLKKKIGKDFGSGYQTDPKTIKFLKENWKNHPEVFRKNWGPYKKIIAAQSQSKISSF